MSQQNIEFCKAATTSAVREIEISKDPVFKIVGQVCRALSGILSLLAAWQPAGGELLDVNHDFCL